MTQYNPKIVPNINLSVSVCVRMRLPFKLRRRQWRIFAEMTPLFSCVITKLIAGTLTIVCMIFFYQEFSKVADIQVTVGPAASRTNNGPMSRGLLQILRKERNLASNRLSSTMDAIIAQNSHVSKMGEFRICFMDFAFKLKVPSSLHKWSSKRAKRTLSRTHVSANHIWRFKVLPERKNVLKAEEMCSEKGACIPKFFSLETRVRVGFNSLKGPNLPLGGTPIQNVDLRCSKEYVYSYDSYMVFPLR